MGSKFLKSKALIYKGENKTIRVKSKSPLVNEIKEFFDNKKPITDIKLATDILFFLKNI